MKENMTDSMQVMKDAMPKLMSLYVAVAVGLKSFPFKRWKISFGEVSFGSYPKFYVAFAYVLDELEDDYTQE